MIHIAYRAYPKLQRATPFAMTKRELVEKCLRSLANSLTDYPCLGNVDLTAILDSCPEYDAIIRQYFEGQSIFVDRAGNARTFGMQLDVLLASQAEFVAFIEDDYDFNGCDWFKVITALDCGADFVTPYDHPDYHRSGLHRDFGQPTIQGWHERCSACMTFVCRRSTLEETADAFRTYAHGNLDVSAWIALTGGPWLHKYSLPAWLFTPRRMLCGKRYSLWSPDKSLAHHVCGFEH